MKKNKTLCFDNIIIEHLEKQDSQSSYISDLILQDMKQHEAKEQAKSQNMSLDELHAKTQAAEEEKAQKRIEFLKRRTAWANLPFEVREAIRAEQNWGRLWDEQLYDLYLKNNNSLSLTQLNFFLVERVMAKNAKAMELLK